LCCVLHGGAAFERWGECHILAHLAQC
jgi:hypothetical protein